MEILFSRSINLYAYTMPKESSKFSSLLISIVWKKVIKFSELAWAPNLFFFAKFWFLSYCENLTPILSTNLASFAVAVSLRSNLHNFETSTASAFLNDVRCAGTEHSILNCSHTSGVSASNCRPAGVVCPCKQRYKILFETSL